MLRALVVWLLAGCALIAMLALGVVALGFALLVGPIVLLALAWVAGGKLKRYERERSRGSGSAVYEGEFRVLEERRR